MDGRIRTIVFSAALIAVLALLLGIGDL